MARFGPFDFSSVAAPQADGLDLCQDAKSVHICSPPSLERCLGGQITDLYNGCGTRYAGAQAPLASCMNRRGRRSMPNAGPYCGLCATGYFRKGKLCAECDGNMREVMYAKTVVRHRFVSVSNGLVEMRLLIVCTRLALIGGFIGVFLLSIFLVPPKIVFAFFDFISECIPRCRGTCANLPRGHEHGNIQGLNQNSFSFD